MFTLRDMQALYRSCAEELKPSLPILSNGHHIALQCSFCVALGSILGYCPGPMRLDLHMSRHGVTW